MFCVVRVSPFMKTLKMMGIKYTHTVGMPILYIPELVLMNLAMFLLQRLTNGGSRKFPVQSPEIMENNLNQGMFKWKSITDNDGF